MKPERQEYTGMRYQAGDGCGPSPGNAVYIECSFEGCRFQDLAWRDLAFVNCLFRDCTLKNVIFDGCAMLNSGFSHCELVGIDWSGLRHQGRHLPLFSGMTDCLMKYATFVKMRLPGMDFSRSTMLDCHFQECALREAHFGKVGMENTAFDGCDLTGADFRGASGYGINIAANTVRRAKFSMPEAMTLLGGLDIVVEA